MKSLRSAEHKKLTALLIAARQKSGLTQQQLAEHLGRPQSYVAKIESGERRIDVLEFLAITRAIGADPIRLRGEALNICAGIGRCRVFSASRLTYAPMDARQPLRPQRRSSRQAGGNGSRRQS